MKGNFVSLCRRRKRMKMQAHVRSKVRKLKFLKVRAIIYQGFVRALEFAATKNAFRF